MNRDENLFQRLWSVIYPEKNAERGKIDVEVGEGVERLHRIVSQGEPDYAGMWERICRDVDKRRRVGRQKMWKYAAMIALPLMGGVFGMLLMQREGKQTPVAVAEIPVTPGTGKGVRLILSTGDVLEVGKLTQNVMTESVAEICRDSNSGLIYRPQQTSDTAVYYNTLEVPVAADYKLQLADGTVVFMNSESKLRYPVVFQGGERKVYLEGEAYFEVARDAEKPFRVMVGEVQVEVLGTSFNINAYGDRHEIQTTLVNGRVRVSRNGGEVVLKPGEQAVCSAGQMAVRKVDVKEFVSWKEGMFFFNHMSLEDIMLQMRRWYDIDAVFLQQELRNYTFTGMINKALTAREIFQIIEKTIHVHFQMIGNQVMIDKI